MTRKKKSKEDLRRHPRVDIHIPAEYQFLRPSEEGRKKIFFETENISLGGLMFYSYTRLKLEQDLLIQMYVDRNLVEFSARVAWISEWSNPKDPIKAFAIGLQYFKITPAAIAKINEAASRIVLLQPKTKDS
jgi:c-di-GMP-binding flagellar brake protein YcgR